MNKQPEFPSWSEVWNLFRTNAECDRARFIAAGSKKICNCKKKGCYGRGYTHWRIVRGTKLYEVCECVRKGWEEGKTAMAILRDFENDGKNRYLELQAKTKKELIETLSEKTYD